MNLIGVLFGWIPVELGKFLNFIYHLVPYSDYGMAIIVFTIIIKFCLLPLTVKQLKSSAKMQELQPAIQELQKKYKNDKQKLNEELMKFYQENKYNPASGCLPLLVQMPILFSLYYVINQPITYMLGVSLNYQTDKAGNYFDPILKIIKSANSKFDFAASGHEIKILEFFNKHQDKLADTGGKLTQKSLINMDFLHTGLNLGDVPKFNIFDGDWKYNIVLLILPIIAVTTTYISTKLSMPKITDKNANPMMSSMLYMGPIMTLWFAFIFPTGLILYWTVGYVFQIFQQLFINKYILKKGEIPLFHVGRANDFYKKLKSSSLDNQSQDAVLRYISQRLFQSKEGLEANWDEVEFENGMKTAILNDNDLCYKIGTAREKVRNNVEMKYLFEKSRDDKENQKLNQFLLAGCYPNLIQSNHKENDIKTTIIKAKDYFKKLMSVETVNHSTYDSGKLISDKINISKNEDLNNRVNEDVKRVSSTNDTKNLSKNTRNDNTNQKARNNKKSGNKRRRSKS